MPDGKSDDDCPGCNVYPGKARHAFDAAENLVPIVFTGARVHILLKTGAPWALLERSPSRPSDAGLSWSAYSMLKVNSGDYLPNRLSLSTAHDVRNRFGCGSAMADLNLDSGNCNYEAIGRSANGRLDVSVNGHLVGWTKLVGSLVEIDCKYPRSTVSALVNPTTKECAFHCLQVRRHRRARFAIRHTWICFEHDIEFELLLILLMVFFFFLFVWNMMAVLLTPGYYLHLQILFRFRLLTDWLYQFCFGSDSFKKSFVIRSCI